MMRREEIIDKVAGQLEDGEVIEWIISAYLNDRTDDYLVVSLNDGRLAIKHGTDIKYPAEWDLCGLDEADGDDLMRVMELDVKKGRTIRHLLAGNIHNHIKCRKAVRIYVMRMLRYVLTLAPEDDEGECKMMQDDAR